MVDRERSGPRGRGRKGATDSESSEGSSSSYGFSAGNAPPPSCASSWKLRDLKVLGITYDEEALTLEEFMSRLKSRRECKILGADKMPSLSKKLIELNKEFWTFSLDFGNEECSERDDDDKIKEIEDVLKSFQEAQREIKSRLAAELKDDASDWWDIIGPLIGELSFIICLWPWVWTVVFVELGLS